MFFDEAVKLNIALLSVGYLFRVETNTYPEVVMKIHFVLLALLCICCQMGNTSGNHTAFGFCHDSPNSLMSEKII